MSFLSTLLRLGKLGTTSAGIKELCAAHAAERRQALAATELKGAPSSDTSTPEPGADGSDTKGGTK